MFDFTVFPTLITPRLHLRQLTLDDADSIMAVFGVPEMLRFLNNPPVDTREKAVGMLNWFEEMYQKHDAITWAITLRRDNRQDNQLIGTCGTYNWDRDNRHVDIGYHIIPSHWGQGYATEAAHALIGWCFDNLNVHRIQADCTDGNTASERVLLKCGFKVEGIWRESCWEHGRFVDIKQFGLLRREYERN